MKTIREIRIENLAALIAGFGSNAALAKETGKSEAQISQWLNASKDSKTQKPRGMSDDIARELEAKCHKEIGWMDNDHSTPYSAHNVVTLGANEKGAPYLTEVMRDLISIAETMSEYGKAQLVGQAKIIARDHPRQKNHVS